MKKVILVSESHFDPELDANYLQPAYVVAGVELSLDWARSHIARNFPGVIVTKEDVTPDKMAFAIESGIWHWNEINFALVPLKEE